MKEIKTKYAKKIIFDDVVLQKDILRHDAKKIARIIMKIV